MLIPTFNRPAALAVTLTSLCSQTFTDFRVIVSDQTEDYDVADAGEVKAPVRVLQAHGHEVRIFKHLPRRGMAEQRQFLLDQVTAPYALFLDDDLILEPWVIRNMLAAIREEGDLRVCRQRGDRPELPGRRAACTSRRSSFGTGRCSPRPSCRTATVGSAGSCTTRPTSITSSSASASGRTTRASTRWPGSAPASCTTRPSSATVGGYSFWQELPPEHTGEDVLAQMRVMAKYGGCGILPSGVYHLELPTTVVDRQVDAPKVLAL